MTATERVNDMKPFQTNAPEANWVEISDLEARNNARRFVRNARAMVNQPTFWQRVAAWLNASI
jgi:hypothetical protein